MKNARACFTSLWSCPVAVSSGIVLISVIALGTAFTAQFALHMEPCILCLYQRIPYAICIVLGLAGLSAHKNTHVVSSVVALAALAFLIDAGLGFYHMGVEHRWWESMVEGCKVPKPSQPGETLLDQILKAPSVPCDQIAWRDPVLHLSMATWNTVLCVFLAVNCAVAALKIRRTA